jgi:hypothetical protein
MTGIGTHKQINPAKYAGLAPAVGQGTQPAYPA